MILPAAAYGAVDPVAQALVAPEPFVWGEGGAQMTPAEVAARRKAGMDRMRAGADYSPIGHWTQGLARVGEGILGGLEVAGARKDREKNDAADAEMRAALASREVNDEMIAAALLNPAASDATRGYAGMLMEARQPKAAAPTNIEKLMMARGIPRGSPEWNETLSAALANEVDPFVTFQGPTMGYTGRQSGLAAAMGGGGQASGASQGAVPPVGAVEDGYRFKGGDPKDPSNWEEVGGPASAPGGFLGG